MPTIRVYQSADGWRMTAPNGRDGVLDSRVLRVRVVRAFRDGGRGVRLGGPVHQKFVDELR